jgi:hypothetical protein
MSDKIEEDDVFERPEMPQLGGLYGLESEVYPELNGPVSEDRLFALALQLYKIKAISTRRNFFAYLFFSIETEQYEQFKEYYASLDESLEKEDLKIVCPTV